MSEETPKVYSAIAAVMADLAKEGITKDRKNQQQGYNFRGIDDVYNALSPVLSRHDLCMLPRILSRSVTERQTQKGNALFYVVVEAEFDLVCSLDGSRHTIRTYGEAMDSADKATNKAMSAAYKYAAMQAFAIPTEGDNDADATTHEVAAQTAREPVKPASKADSRETYARLSKAIRALASIEEFDRWCENRHVIDAINSLPSDWRQKLFDERDDRRNVLLDRATLDVDFPGDQPLEAAE
jgi:hypothetical protein